jgi:hypothetical protein
MAKIRKTITSRTQNACDTAQRRNQAAVTVPTAAAAPTIICHAAGGAAPVRRGMAVNRKPRGKQIMDPWIWVIAWKTGR